LSWGVLPRVSPATVAAQRVSPAVLLLQRVSPAAALDPSLSREGATWVSTRQPGVSPLAPLLFWGGGEQGVADGVSPRPLHPSCRQGGVRGEETSCASVVGSPWWSAGGVSPLPRRHQFSCQFLLFPGRGGQGRSRWDALAKGMTGCFAGVEQWTTDPAGVSPQPVCRRHVGHWVSPSGPSLVTGCPRVTTLRVFQRGGGADVV